MKGHNYSYIISLIIIILFSHSLSLAQQPIQKHLEDSAKLFSSPTRNICSNDIILYNLRKDPAFVAKEEEMNKAILTASRSLTGDTITLPVVVHIINENPNSITDAQVITGIQNLNDAYSKAGIYSASAGADTKIRFCLSQNDPDGGNTTGITRTTSFFSTHLNKDIEDGRLKNLIQWDPSKYINIWLIKSIDAEAYADFICGNWYRLGVGGYATMPPGGGMLDGIVITAFGILLAHEMGHYLGLYHTFEGGCFNNDCTANGDRVCDTPPDNSVRPSAGCSSPQNSCNSDTLSNYSNGFFHTDVPDQIANFMDYGNSACSIEFTQGQADRMRAAITTQRNGLLQDECTRPCVENIIAGFTRNLASPLSGDLITFTNTSTGAANYEWLVNGSVISTSTDFSFTFNTPGKNKVTLKAFNTPGCFGSSTDYVIVTCGVTARFYTNKKTIASKINVWEDSIVFKNTSVNAQSYQWLISNNKGMAEQVVSTGTDLIYVFSTPATYSVRLVATNGACSDTTSVYFVPVLDPTADGFPFSVTLFCYQQNKVRINFCIADFGYAPLPKNTPVNFYDANPLLPTAHKLSPTFYLPFDVPGGNCFICFTHVLDVDYYHVEKIYLVFNDSGKTIPVILPNAPLQEKNYFNNIQSSQSNRTNVFISICQGQNYAGYSASGTYIDTLASKINGCDSIRTLQLTIKPVFTSIITTTICEGQNYAGHTTSGTFVDVYTAVNGCDSTRTLHLTVKPKASAPVTTSICEGQNYAGHTTTGIFVDVYTAANGCDSTRTLYLTVKPTVSTPISVSICERQNYLGYKISGTYVDVFTGANGCDSTRTLYLIVKPIVNTTVTEFICQGESYASHTTSGTYVDVYPALNGCDSTRTLYLTVKPTTSTTIFTSICQGENYAGHTTSGTYVDVYSAINGCDSTRTLHLIVKPVVTTSITAIICEGYNYAGHTTSGTFVDVYTAINGCDSTRTLQLTINPRWYTTVNHSICMGESYLAAGHLQTATGIYFDTTKTYLGCDSITITNLTVNPLPFPDLGPDRGVCIGDTLILDPGIFSNYLWQDGTINSTYPTNIPGNYFVTVTNIFGCKASDTMKILKILSLPSDFLPPDSSLCRGNILQVRMKGYVNYTWSTGSANNFIDITKSGTYNLVVKDRYGCIGSDSIKVLFYNCVDILVPNAFTPNKDGINEVFKPFIPAPVTNYHMQVWNRWGQLMFKTEDYTKAWDGTFKNEPQSSGVYVYLITLKSIDGINIKKYGTVILIK